MTEPCQFDEPNSVAEMAHVIVTCLCERVAIVGVQPGDQGAGEVGDADRVFETVVRSAWEHEIGAAELFQVAETLDVRRVQDGYYVAGQLEVAVDRVVYYCGWVSYCSGFGMNGGMVLAYLLRGWGNCGGEVGRRL